MTSSTSRLPDVLLAWYFVLHFASTGCMISPLVVSVHLPERVDDLRQRVDYLGVPRDLSALRLSEHPHHARQVRLQALGCQLVQRLMLQLALLDHLVRETRSLIPVRLAPLRVDGRRRALDLERVAPP